MNAYWEEHGQFLAGSRNELGYISQWSAALGDGTLVAAIADAQIADAIARWRKPGRLSSATINRYVGFLRRVWGRAPLYHSMKVQPIAWKLLRLDEPEPPDRSVSSAELASYLKALPTRSHRITLWGLFTGLRLGALLKLRREDFDFEAGIIHAVSKGRAGGKPTPIPMTQPVLALLTLGPLPEVGRIFAVTRQMVRKDRETARTEAGLPDFRFHDLRHTFAQTLEDAGLGDAITAALHHSDPRLRNRYSRARIRRTATAVDEAFATRNRHHG